MNELSNKNYFEVKVKGSEVKGSEVKGSEVKGFEVKGSEVKGSEVKSFMYRELWKTTHFLVTVCIEYQSICSLLS